MPYSFGLLAGVGEVVEAGQGVRVGVAEDLNRKARPPQVAALSVCTRGGRSSASGLTPLASRSSRGLQ